MNILKNIFNFDSIYDKIIAQHYGQLIGMLILTYDKENSRLYTQLIFDDYLNSLPIFDYVVTLDDDDLEIIDEYFKNVENEG